ncbi:nitrous oxide reductase family maturation protein NosD [Thioclava atlantica]|uniref:NosD nitrous oxidase accessory protein n=1 Tax=Thioclava atlantica TaxID=1317124 RepID=A0A085U0R1_9RHOB|nr:nitrous oxide reductase family maturation protein NosD [Thioclava atlantica]KFE36558.1 NosD nitrous oxidase accessory protein [Thioclava atlantica]
MRFRPFLALILCLTPLAAAAGEVTVRPGPEALIRAIAKARPGDVLILETGRYAGPITIDKPLTLTGQGAEVAGRGTGTVISVTAPDVTLRGLTVTGAGKRLDHLDSGVALAQSARHALVENNRLIGNLIGVDVQGAHDVTVRNNTIEGRDDLRVPERGPGIYVWNAPGLLVEGNRISKGRDGVFVTTSNKATYRRNVMTNLRYAFHSMYSNQLVVEDNVSRGNTMGFALMYSRRLRVTENLSDDDSAHGFFMNFANHAVISHNEVRNGGEKCLFVYNSNVNRITANRFEGCGIGVHFTAGSERNVISGNAFIGNRLQVKYVGTRWLEWSENGTGNYWSDHVAFDIDGNGRADSPYRPNTAIDRVVWSQPMAKLLMGAPAVQLIRWSQQRFPGLLPGGVIDSAPLVSPKGAGLPPKPGETQ